MAIGVSVPPGGNWKNVPHHIPSKRLESIRASYAAGSGSRSTYYGRLHPDFPAYTINTYFNRPGNGCHLHYDFEGGQHRVLSEREAARLQSFPDSFVFHGNHGSIQKQIGNAVPPLLAYQIAGQLPHTGAYVDLFSGAGGFALGFKWAGWTPIVANDIDPSFLKTYASNIHSNTIVGDIRDKSVFKRLVEAVKDSRKADEPLFVLGGPPCQGFSTAGNRRTQDDERNHLFNEYRAFVSAVKPDGFVFENVPGLLNMEGGAVFQHIHRRLVTPGRSLTKWLLRSEEYGIPQRRTRLILLSTPKRWGTLESPGKGTELLKRDDIPLSLPNAISVKEALSDLPALSQGQDGSGLGYCSEPLTNYQRLMRGLISPADYLALLRQQELVEND
ncbi:MAG: hypothetical protein GFGODING_01074 [Flavobacteriales bacterium]|nr:hypothetical protein [Flavobacteriales bacterium]